MVESIKGLSKNVNLSFRYVREDINKLKVNFNALNEKINELNKQNIELIKTIEELRKKAKGGKGSAPKPLPKPKPAKGEKLSFYDVKARKRFESSVYKEVIKNKTLFAVAKSPYGNYDSYRILKKV